MADAVDVGQREARVLEGVEDHGDLELAPGAVELTGGGDIVGDADDRCGAAQRAIPPAHSDDPPAPTRACRADR